MRGTASHDMGATRNWLNQFSRILRMAIPHNPEPLWFCIREVIMSSCRLFHFLSASLAFLVCVGCETGLTSGNSNLHILSYNVQTLFDPVDDGHEYKEFLTGGGAWGPAQYRKRLTALAEAVRASVPTGPDILIFQELENRNVLSDLAAAIAPGKYPYLAISDSEDATLSCGVASRLPFSQLRAHRYRPSMGGPASVPRFVLECVIDTGSGESISLFVTHWKSKLGGERETSPERQMAASLIMRLVEQRLFADPAAAIIVAGDLNCDPADYLKSGEAYPSALMSKDHGPGPWITYTFDREGFDTDFPVLYSPWEDYGGYSYMYEGKRERIDHFLLSPAMARSLISFDASPASFLVDAAGMPSRWNPGLVQGYSDHLPIRITVRISK